MHYKTYAKSIQKFECLCPTWSVSISTFNVLIYDFFKCVKGMYHACITNCS
jgi:hypothetical protein